jgi:hypothetical protein
LPPESMNKTAFHILNKRLGIMQKLIKNEECHLLGCGAT